MKVGASKSSQSCSQSQSKSSHICQKAFVITDICIVTFSGNFNYTVCLSFAFIGLLHDLRALHELYDVAIVVTLWP